MKTLKLRPGMPKGVKYITRDKTLDDSSGWRRLPKKDGDGNYWSKILGDRIDSVHIGNLLKPGEIAKIVK